MIYDVIHTDGKVTRLTVLDLGTPMAEQDAIACETAARLGRPVREIWRIELEEHGFRVPCTGTLK